MDENLLKHWKIQYKNIFCATVGGQEYYFRALTLEEIENIEIISSIDGSSADIEDLYVRTAILYPQDINWDKIKAGYITTLAEEISACSRVSEPANLLESLYNARLSVQEDIFKAMKAFIISAMPYYSEEDLSRLTVDELTEKIAMAERILTIQQSVLGFKESTGVEFIIQSTEEVEQQVVQQSKRESKPAVTREELLRRIRKDEAAMTDASKLMDVNPNEFENLDEDLLLKAAGVIKPEDPIARKLREAMGG